MDGPGAKFCLKRGGVGKELEGSVVVGEGGGGRGGDGRTHGGRNLGVVGGGGWRWSAGRRWGWQCCRDGEGECR